MDCAQQATRTHVSGGRPPRPQPRSPAGHSRPAGEPVAAASAPTPLGHQGHLLVRGRSTHERGQRMGSALHPVILRKLLTCSHGERWGHPGQLLVSKEGLHGGPAGLDPRVPTGRSTGEGTIGVHLASRMPPFWFDAWMPFSSPGTHTQPPVHTHSRIHVDRLARERVQRDPTTYVGKQGADARLAEQKVDKVEVVERLTAE